MSVTLHLLLRAGIDIELAAWTTLSSMFASAMLGPALGELLTSPLNPYIPLRACVSCSKNSALRCWHAFLALTTVPFAAGMRFLL